MAAMLLVARSVDCEIHHQEDQTNLPLSIMLYHAYNDCSPYVVLYYISSILCTISLLVAAAWGLFDYYLGGVVYH